MSLGLDYKCTNFVIKNGALYECYGRSPSNMFLEVETYLSDGFWNVKHPDYPTGMLWVCENHRFEDLIGDLYL